MEYLSERVCKENEKIPHVLLFAFQLLWIESPIDPNSTTALEPIYVWISLGFSWGI